MNFIPITPNEEKGLKVVIEDWATRTPFQQAIAAALWRGHTTPQSVADYLQVSVDEVRAELKSIWGLLYDHSTRIIHIK